MVSKEEAGEQFRLHSIPKGKGNTKPVKLNYVINNIKYCALISEQELFPWWSEFLWPQMLAILLCIIC